MKKIVFSFFALFITLFTFTAYAQLVVEDSTQILIDKVEQSLH